MNEWKNFSASEHCLKNKIIAITGAGSGIGRTLAKHMAHYGATIILIGRTVEKLEAVYDEIEKNGGPQPAIVPIDFSTATDADYKNIQTNIEKEFGKLDGLIHNAAELGERTSIATYSIKTWETLMQVNVSAPFALSKYCLPLLQKSDNGSIVFTSSSVGVKGRAYWGAYAASKAAIENLMETLADELEDTSNIRANSINPGATRTDMRAQAFPAEDPITVKSTDDLVPLYVYFMSDDSIGTTGKKWSF
jgi:NAD(P)-dependent dehydrogenase (short-subunit alcohol dehydrogenase family)